MSKIDILCRDAPAIWKIDNLWQDTPTPSNTDTSWLEDPAPVQSTDIAGNQFYDGLGMPKQTE